MNKRIAKKKYKKALEVNGIYYGVNCKNTTPITFKSFDKTTSENTLTIGRVGMSFASVLDVFSDSEYSKYVCTDPKNDKHCD